MSVCKAELLVALAIALGIGCAGTHDQPKHNGASSALETDAGNHPMTGNLGQPPAATEEEKQKASECTRLRDEAIAQFDDEMGNVQVAQCDTDADCAWSGFDTTEDGCWATCTTFRGTRAYGGALKEIADDVCTEFRSKGCKVAPPGCPLPPQSTWACQNHKCVEQ